MSYYRHNLSKRVQCTDHIMCRKRWQFMMRWMSNESDLYFLISFIRLKDTTTKLSFGFSSFFIREFRNNIPRFDITGSVWTGSVLIRTGQFWSERVSFGQNGSVLIRTGQFWSEQVRFGQNGSVWSESFRLGRFRRASFIFWPCFDL